MKIVKFLTLILMGSLIAAGETLAQQAIFSEEFTEDSPIGASQFNECTSFNKFTHVVGPIQASASGEYIYQDAGIGWGLDISLSLHNGLPDINALNATMVDVWDDHGHANLLIGNEYYLVAQPLCENTEGVWGATLDGPGTITGGGVVQAPDSWSGTFDGTEQQIELFDFCGPSYTDVTSPMRVPRTGYYWITSTNNSDQGFWTGVRVYEDSFDPQNPAENEVQSQTFGALFLKTGTDYVIAAQAVCGLHTGDWAIVIAPQGPFRLNPGLNGGYLNPATSGQGFLLDVLPEAGIIFYAEFTWDTVLPEDGMDGAVGTRGNRWFTAQGPYDPEASMVTLDVYFASGGVFDDPATVTVEKSGTVTLDFTDECGGGLRSYELDTGPMGTSPFTRLAPDNEPLCYDQFAEPGVVVPW